jgi:hypothetical protein
VGFGEAKAILHDKIAFFVHGNKLLRHSLVPL